MPKGHSPLNIKSDGSPEKSKMFSLAPIAAAPFLVCASTGSAGQTKKVERIAGLDVLKTENGVLLINQIE